jgi:Tol biopolymer transport system component
VQPDRWRQLSRIYHAIAQCEPSERAAFLDQVCRDDSVLRRELDSLLAHERSGDSLVEAGAARPLPSLVGRAVGSYDVRAVLGAGGMGHVYLAHDTKLHRDVALKVLPELFATDLGRLARFKREAQLLASLNHPNIAAIYGFEEGTVVGAGFSRLGGALVLELVEGPTLADRIAQGPIPLDEALHIARQIAEALEAAHEHGVIHRDLKPANIKVRPDGTVKVLDFGLAKALPPDVADVASVDLARTARGVILGTVPYMAPEQARGRETDGRADIWAFGVVLYEMVTGRSPFAADSLAETVGAVLYKEPDWGRVPDRLQSLLRRCLEKDADRRPQTIADVRSGLAEPSSSTHARRGRRMWPASAAMAGVAAAVALAVVYFDGTPPGGVYPVRFQIAAPPQSTFGNYFVVSPDGRHVAFLASDPTGRRTIWVHSLESGESRPLPRAGDLSASSIIWSGDSRFIGFVGGRGTLSKIDINGGRVQAIGDVPEGWGGGAWNRDDVIVLGQAEGGLLRLSGAGGAPTLLTRLDPSRQEVGHGGPRFLPDGRHFIYSRASRIPDYTALYVGSVDAGPDEQPAQPLLVTDSRPAYAPSSDPDRGYLLAVREGVLLAYPFDNRRLTLAGDPVPIADGVGAVGNGPVSIASVSASGNGVLAYRRAERVDGIPVWVDRDGRELEALTDDAVGGARSPRISPDGKRVALMVGGDVWIYHTDRRPPIRVTFDSVVGTPIWSADGRRLVYEDHTLNGQLRSVLADRIATPEVASPRGHYHPFGWGPDGGVLAAVLSTTMDVTAERTDGSSTVADIDVVTFAPDERATARDLVNTTSIEGSAGIALSPDGRWLAYTSNITGRSEVWVQPYAGPGAPVRVSPNGGQEPQWAREGGELYYIEGNRMMSVPVRRGPTFAFEPPVQLFEHRYAREMVPSYDVGPDGRFLMIKPSGPPPGTAPISVVLNWTELLTRRLTAAAR